MPLIPRILLGLVLTVPVTVQASHPYWCPERGTVRCKDFKTEEEKSDFLSDRIKQIDLSLKKDGVELLSIIYPVLKQYELNKYCLKYLSMEPSQELIEKLKEKGMDAAECGANRGITYISDIEFAGDSVYVVYSGYKLGGLHGHGSKFWVSCKTGYCRVEKFQNLWVM